MLAKRSYVRRHALLATDPGKVSVELHVGLDLVQAGDSESPCRTFSDALTIMEGSERPRAFLWALREAEAPTGSSSACKQLGARLVRLRAIVEPAAPAPAPAPAPRKKSRSRPNRTSTRAKPVLPKPVAKTPEPPPPPKKGVATKLDDDLRGL